MTSDKQFSYIEKDIRYNMIDIEKRKIEKKKKKTERERERERKRERERERERGCFQER